MESTGKIRVLVLDDNPVLVDGLNFLVNSTRQLAALTLSNRDQKLHEAVTRLEPDVIVADPVHLERTLEECDMDLFALRAKAKLIAYCDVRDTQPGETYVTRGYSGVVTKSVASPRLLRAIKSVHAGDVVIDETVLALFDQRPLAMDPIQRKLSLKEEFVLRHVALGKAMKEIAADIQLSAKTVETYKYRAIRKLDLRTRSDIVSYAISVGWLQH